MAALAEEWGRPWPAGEGGMGGETAFVSLDARDARVFADDFSI